ncbi:MAG: RHS repeat-associated core domain-containing protein, partial [Candidatus Omnitrophica bacterium]|nr:RHS repeat-associated core domain-containing protein [Candidatus Omnitrophota bacterium]
MSDFGLVFYGARYYKPILGRFINTDPLGMVDGPHLYRFCLGDPVNYLDPWGLMVGFGYMGGPAIGLGAGGIPGLPPDISGGGISQPGEA